MHTRKIANQIVTDVLLLICLLAAVAGILYCTSSAGEDANYLAPTPVYCKHRHSWSTTDFRTTNDTEVVHPSSDL